jgi:GTP-binding protein HflX
MSSAIRGVSGERPRAVIVGVARKDVSNEAFEASLKELGRLGETLGLEIIGRVTQRRDSLAAKTAIGAGKLRELAAFTGGTGVVPKYVAPGKGNDDEADGFEAEDEGHDEDDDAGDSEVNLAGSSLPPKGKKATVVLVDDDLTPGQARNLEKATGAEVMDRSMVILSIFQRHARTREARMQVEIARLSYMAPRLRESGTGQDRQAGGGGKGAGETALELDRRRIRDRIAELRKEILIVQREADTRRNRRAGADSQSVALVGYTNAGKSSLMRTLTGDDVYVADQLFATLDTTVRILKPETRPRVLVSDTVGFIKKLPHDLVASFRSTLEEAKDAGLLLHVVDASDPAFRDQHDVTVRVLDEIGATANPKLLVLNKADQLDAEARSALAREFPDAVIMSARSPEDVQALHQRVVSFFEESMIEEELLVPYSEQRVVALLHERCRVLSETYDEAGARVRVRAPKAVLSELRSELPQKR